MDAVFLKILNMSITAGWVIIAVILLRLLMKKVPRGIICCLWAIVGIRLALPFSIESVFSLLPSARTIDTTVSTAGPYIETGFSAIDDQVNDYFGNHYYEGGSVPADHFSNIINVFTVIWLIGLAVMLIYSVVSYTRIYRKVSASICLRDNIYYCDDISTPFILGIVKPRIYVPSGMPEEDLKYVIAHENAHLKRRDHLWKPIGFVVLSVYWFNPLVWAAYILLCRDIELACDERVMKEMGGEVKKAYAEALLSYSVQRRMVMTCPLAFGETGVKGRVKAVLHYKKPAFWIIVVAVIVCIIAAAGFLTNPLHSKLEEQYSILPDEVSYIGVEIGVQQSYSITLDEAVEYAADLLNDMQINRNAVSQDKDRSTRITVGYEQTAVTYYFNENFTEVWIDDNVKPSLVYKVKNPKSVRKFFAEHAEDRIVNEMDIEPAISSAILEHNKGKYLEGEFACASYSQLANESGDDGTMIYYLIAMYAEYEQEGDEVVQVSGGCSPAAVTFKIGNDGNYAVSEYWEPRDGALYSEDMDDKFPEGVDYGDANVSEQLQQECDGLAERHFEFRIFSCDTSHDPGSPTIMLSRKDNSCQFFTSMLSSYLFVGTYEWTDNRLKLQSDDGSRIYCFDVVEENGKDTFLFDAENSSPVETYQYDTPVVEGTVFREVE